MDVERILLEGLPLLALFIFSIILHELAHGLVAERFGDDTARQRGMITLNPIPHIDPVMSILVPGFMWLSTGGYMLGSVKGVPVRMERLRPRLLGNICVSLAGIAVNVLLASLFKLALRVVGDPSWWPQLPGLIEKIGMINCLLVVFNLLPLPPLDGFHLVSSFLPEDLRKKARGLDKYGILILVALFLGVPRFRGFVLVAIGAIWKALP